MDFLELGTLVGTDIKLLNDRISNVGDGGGGGQFSDKGTAVGKAIGYLAQVTAENEAITIKAGTNAFAVDSITVANGGSIEIEDGSVFKVL